MRGFMRTLKTEASVVVAAVGMAALCVGAYVYGASDRGDLLDPALTVVVALIGLFYGWFLFALLRRRQPDRGRNSDSGWGILNGRR